MDILAGIILGINAIAINYLYRQYKKHYSLKDKGKVFPCPLAFILYDSYFMNIFHVEDRLLYILGIYRI